MLPSFVIPTESPDITSTLPLNHLKEYSEGTPPEAVQMNMTTSPTDTGPLHDRVTVGRTVTVCRGKGGDKDDGQGHTVMSTVNLMCLFFLAQFCIVRLYVHHKMFAISSVCKFVNGARLFLV